MVWDKAWILALALVLLGIAVWSWRGRSASSRWWLRIWQGDTMALGFAPGVGLVLLGIGMIALVPGDEPQQTPVGMIASFVWLAGFPVFVIGSWGPRWWGPRWYRSMSDRSRVEALRGPAGKLARSMSRPRGGTDRGRRNDG